MAEQERLDRWLREEVARNDIGGAQRELGRGANPNVVDDQGTPMIVLCAQHHYVEIAKSLLDKGADVNAKDKNGDSAVMAAVHNNDMDFAKSLIIENRADVNSVDNEGMTVLMLAAPSGSAEFGGFVAGKVSNLIINARDKDGDTAVTIAAEHGNFGFLKSLVGIGADINARGKDGHTAVTIAAEHENFGFLKSLVGIGADINARDEYGATAVTIAAEHGNFGFLKSLVGIGADIKGDDAAVTIAAEHGNFDFLKSLLGIGAKPGSRTLQACLGHIEIAKFLVVEKKLVDVNAKDEHGGTALMGAARSAVNIDEFQDALDFAKFLFENGADVNTRDNNGGTALLRALNIEPFELAYRFAKLLSDHGAVIYDENEYLVSSKLGADSFKKTMRFPNHPRILADDQANAINSMEEGSGIDLTLQGFQYFIKRENNELNIYAVINKDSLLMRLKEWKKDISDRGGYADKLIALVSSMKETTVEKEQKKINLKQKPQAPAKKKVVPQAKPNGKTHSELPKGEHDRQVA